MNAVKQDEDDNFLYPCTLQIGQGVLFQLPGGLNDGTEARGYLRAITFTSSKVRFAVFFPGVDPPDSIDASKALGLRPGSGMTIHNVDSCLVTPDPDWDGCLWDFGFDNYS